MYLFEAPEEPVAPAWEPSARLSLADRMPPREYQREADDNFFAAYERGKRHMLYRLATGCGKTYNASITAERWLGANPARRRVMVIAYEKELVYQFRSEIADFLPHLDVGLEMADEGKVSAAFVPPITVSCRQSLYVNETGLSRLYKFDPLKFDWLVICDEAHGWKYSLSSCQHIVEHFEQNPASAWLGLTATPQRGDKVTLARLFGHVCCELRLRRAIDEGYLVPFKQKFIQVEGVDFKNLKEASEDFDEKELEKILSEREQLLSMCQPLLDLVGEKRTLVFCPGKNCAKLVARTINAEIDEHGLPHGRAESMDGDTPQNIRRDIIQRHQTGQIQFLVVCNLCRAGYNDPGIEAVAVFRPTKSRVMAEQMKGRGARTLRGTINGLKTAEERKAAIAASAKPYCLVIDLVGVSGMPEVASTAHLLASGLPDEVYAKANKRQADGTEETVEESVRKAKEEYDAEERARKEAEEREAARKKREEQERREEYEARRKARLQGEVKYHARDVGGAGGGGSHTSFSPMVAPATDKQVWKMVKELGWKEAEARRMSRSQASGIIGNGVKRNATSGPSPVSHGKPTPQQLSVLQKFGKPPAKTFTEAAEAIAEINRQLQAKRNNRA